MEDKTLTNTETPCIALQPLVRLRLSDDVTIYKGNCFNVIPELSGIDCLLTDPPYSSGGQFRGDRSQKPSSKYINTDSVITCRVEFTGDNRDQRSFLFWASMWSSMVLDSCKLGATAIVFTDWRQLPTMTDALQCGGWVWRNIVTWWKPGIRMQRGRFSSSAEYVVYASHGIPNPGERSPQNVLSYKPVGGDDKFHIAEKPVELIQDLLGVTPVGAVVLDPFMGSGTTGVACIRTGRKFIGIEKDEIHFENARKRLAAEVAQCRLDLAT